MSVFSAFFSNAWRQEAAAAELALLHSVPHDGVNYTISDTMVQLAGGPQTIHTIEASAVPTKEGQQGVPVILWHGYGQGAGSWFRNLPGLARTVASSRSKVFALDWLGVGLSSRPEWTAEMDAEPAKAEKYFVDALESWRQSQGVEQMHLVGHSMGGILAVSYAERFPNRLASLTLASPAGVPRPPAESLHERVASMPFGFRKAFFGLAANMWEGGFTPQGVVRRTSWVSAIIELRRNGFCF